MFYLGALGLFVLGSLLLRNTSPYSRVGGVTYDKRRKRRSIGVILLFAGAILLGIAVLRQFVSSNL